MKTISWKDVFLALTLRSQELSWSKESFIGEKRLGFIKLSLYSSCKRLNVSSDRSLTINFESIYNLSTTRITPTLGFRKQTASVWVFTKSWASSNWYEWCNKYPMVYFTVFVVIDQVVTDVTFCKRSCQTCRSSNTCSVELPLSRRTASTAPKVFYIDYNKTK